MRATYLLATLIVSSTFSYGQLSDVDSIALKNAIHLSKINYQSAIAGNSHVFNGVEYIDALQNKNLDGHAYFLNDDWQDGYVFYDDQLYENVSLRYDLFQNKLLIEHVQSRAAIELITEKIKYFGISNHAFVWLANSGDLKEGFYDLLFSGNINVYAKRYKALNEIIDQKTMVTRLTDKTKFYLFKNGKYFAITNKNSALNVVGEDKPAVKKFLSQAKINFRADPEAALVGMAKFYDELKK